METLQAVKDYIDKEQKLGVEKADQHKNCPRTYGDEYYHGYYDGYLTALYNLSSVIAESET